MLAALSNNPGFGHITAFSRKTKDKMVFLAPVNDAKVTYIVDENSLSWPQRVPPNPIFFSGLATTSAAAGGFEKQYKIDYQLNRDLAEAAHRAGSHTYVLISALGANAKSMFPYVKMKGELDDAVSAMGFKHTVIIRPSVILGPRNQLKQPTRMTESMFMTLTGAFSYVPFFGSYMANKAEDIAEVAVAAALMCEQGKRLDGKPEGVWIISGKQINDIAADLKKKKQEVAAPAS